MIIIYIIIAVALITLVAHLMLTKNINKVRDVANNRPGELRGVTPAEAFAKADEWEKFRKQLWPKALCVVVGLIVMSLVLNR